MATRRELDLKRGSKTSESKSDALRLLALALSATLAFLVSSELLLRGASCVGLLDLDGKGADVASSEWDAHPELRWRLPPNSSGFEGVRFRTNSHGLRDQEIPLKKPDGTRRILALGDSTVFGFGVPFEKSFSERLETMLNKRGGATRFDVINAGVPGYSIYQALMYLKIEGLRFDPDVILLETNFNDRRYVPSADEVDGPLYFSRVYDAFVRRDSLAKSALYRATRRALRGVGVLESGTARYRPIDLDNLTAASVLTDTGRCSPNSSGSPERGGFRSSSSRTRIRRSRPGVSPKSRIGCAAVTSNDRYRACSPRSSGCAARVAPRPSTRSSRLADSTSCWRLAGGESRGSAAFPRPPRRPSKICWST